MFHQLYLSTEKEILVPFSFNDNLKLFALKFSVPSSKSETIKLVDPSLSFGSKNEPPLKEKLRLTSGNEESFTNQKGIPLTVSNSSNSIAEDRLNENNIYIKKN